MLDPTNDGWTCVCGHEVVDGNCLVWGRDGVHLVPVGKSICPCCGYTVRQIEESDPSYG